MSKIDTLISLINYQRQHPKANKSQIAEGVGITPQYLSRCLGELNLMKEHLAPALEADQIHFLLSELDQRDPYQGDIHGQLQGYLSPSPYSGILRMARSNEEPPNSENSLSVSSSQPIIGLQTTSIRQSNSRWIDSVTTPFFGLIGTGKLNGGLQPPSNRRRFLHHGQSP